MLLSLRVDAIGEMTDWAVLLATGACREGDKALLAADASALIRFAFGDGANRFRSDSPISSQRDHRRLPS